MARKINLKNLLQSSDSNEPDLEQKENDKIPETGGNDKNVLSPFQRVRNGCQDLFLAENIGKINCFVN